MAGFAPDDDRWWRDFDGLVLGLLPRPGRILEVGSGDGSLGRRLRAASHEVIGVDPNALDDVGTIRGRIEDVEPERLGQVDLVCASMAFHHIDLPGALAAVDRVLAPHGPLVLNEFDWPAYDARAAAWIDEAEREDPVATWHGEHADLHSRAALVEGLETAGFVVREETPRPHLARMLRQPEREPDELAAIAAGRVPALGFWLVATRR